jgi:hypothetical protein
MLAEFETLLRNVVQLIRPGFSVAVPEIRDLHPIQVDPYFVRVFLFFQIYSLFLIIYFRMEICLGLLRDLPNEDIGNSAAYGAVKSTDVR